MTYQIDQSNKIEQTERNTVIALSNDIQYAIVLKAKDKREIQKIFRSIGQPKNYVYFTFAALLTIVLKEIKTKNRVVIDREYMGHEKAIGDRLIFYLNKTVNFEFGLVGKLSPAHILAARIATGKQKPNQIVKVKQILEVILPIKKIGHPLRRDRGPLNFGLDTDDRRPSRSNK